MTTSRIGASQLYANDEDILVHCAGDFPQLCPVGQVLAYATDGVITSASWDVASATTDFEAQGIEAGHVIQLIAPFSVYKTPDILAIESVSGTTATMRRVGFGAGLGEPPAASTGITFRIATLYPQIEAATYELDHLFGVDREQFYVDNRRFGDLVDAREAQRACIAWVLKEQYLAMARMSEREDDFTYKSKRWRDECERIIGRARVRFERSLIPSSISPTRQLRIER